MKAAHIIVDGKMTGFIAREADGCRGCLFHGRRSAVCMEASHQAVRAGQPDCDDAAPGGGAYIYVGADPRQLPLIDTAIGTHEP